MANANIPQIQTAITTMTTWINWANTQKEAEPGQMLTELYDKFVQHQIIAKQVALDLLAVYAQKGIV